MEALQVSTLIPHVSTLTHFISTFNAIDVPAMNPNDYLSAIEASLMKNLEGFNNLSNTVDNFSTANNNTPNKLIQTQIDSIFANLQHLDSTIRIANTANKQLHNIQIPYSLLNSIDNGSNPELLLSNELLNNSNKNDAIRGKVFAIKAIKDNLTAKFQQWEKNESARPSDSGTAVKVEQKTNPAEDQTGSTAVQVENSNMEI
jgi:hypothetical protein